MTPWMELARKLSELDFKWCTLTSTSGSLIAATLSAGLALANNAQLTESDVITEEAGYRRGLKVHPLYIGTPLGAFVDHRRGRTRVILVLTASPVFRESLFTYAKVLFIKSVSRAKRHQCLYRFASQGNTVLVTLEGYRAKRPKRLSNQWIWTNSKRFIGQKLKTG